MDKQTLDAYNTNAALYCERYRLIMPSELRQYARAFFHLGQPTVDIGCGSGRDVDWLNRNGYPAVGYDASPAMLAEARAAFPDIAVGEAALPDLVGVPDQAYTNVLCSATIMHLPSEALLDAVLSLARIIQPEGRLLLSYRTSAAPDGREDDGRLFTSIPPGRLTLLLEAAGLQVITTHQQPDSYRAGIDWLTLLAEKKPSAVARGLEHIQSVLTQDRKVATYKFALIRARCVISRAEAHLVKWASYVSLWSVAVQ